MAERDTDLTDAPAHTAMDQFTAHLDRGWDLIHRGDLRGAHLSAEKGLELDPQAPEAHNLLGYIKASMGQADEALELYRQALALDDTFVEAMLNAAEVLIHPLHDFAGARSMIEEALDLAEGPDEIADALLLKYDVAVHQGDKESARRVVNSFPEGPFENARVDFLVGRAFFECGEYPKALRLLAHAIEAEPNYGDAYYTLGLVHEALSDNPAMVQAFLRTREADLALPRVLWAASRNAFEEQVRAAIARLPKPLRAVVENAELFIADLPGAEVVVDGVDPRTSVLFDTQDRSGEERHSGIVNVGIVNVGIVNAGIVNAGPANGGPASDEPRVMRLFVYQRNTERSVEDASGLPEELYLVLEEELCATFPELAAHATRSHEHTEQEEDH